MPTNALAFAPSLHMRSLGGAVYRPGLVEPSSLTRIFPSRHFESLPSLCQIQHCCPSSLRRRTQVAAQPELLSYRDVTAMTHGGRGTKSTSHRKRPSFLSRLRRRRARPARGASIAVEATRNRVEVANSSALALLLPLGFRLLMSSSAMYLQRPVECAASVAGVVLAMARCIVRWRPGFSFVQGIVRSEAVLSGAVLIVVPIMFRWWARMEAGHHDTLKCRSLVQTNLIASSGWICAVLAAVAGNPIFAVLLQVIWRCAAARSLWTWSDLGKNLRDTPGWLHACVGRWRILATYVAGIGAAARILALLVGSFGNIGAISLALSSPSVDFFPGWLVRLVSTPDAHLRLSIAQIAESFCIYVWVSYYLVVFLPYRVLYDEYQIYERRTQQFLWDLTNGPEHDVMFSTKLGSEFPKHLSKRMAQMPPGDDRDFLRLIGIARQKANALTVVKGNGMFYGG